MNKTNIIIEKLKNIQEELKNINNDINNDNIINEIDILNNHFNDTINNIEDCINNTNNYNRNKIKENIIFKIFMPYIIYLSFTIKDDDILAAETALQNQYQQQELKDTDDIKQLSSFNENFLKEILKKYIK